MREVICIFRYEAVEEFFQIASRGWIGIFHDDDAATGVLNKNGDGSVLNPGLIDLRINLIGDLVNAFAVGTHFELVVVDAHFRYVIRRDGKGKIRSDGSGTSLVAGLETAAL